LKLNLNIKKKSSLLSFLPLEAALQRRQHKGHHATVMISALRTAVHSTRTWQLIVSHILIEESQNL